MRGMRAGWSWFFLLVWVSVSGAQERGQLPQPVDWLEAGLMEGFPPAKESLVTKANWLNYPQLTWSLQHARELFPTRNVPRGGKPWEFPVALCSLESIPFKDEHGKDTTFGRFLKDTYTDSVLVLHEGRVVYERYFNQMTPRTPHMLFSVSKSIVGLLAATLVREGVLDERAPVSKYVPELESTALGDATIRDLLDMRVGVKFSEVYTDPRSDIVAYVLAAEWVPTPPGYTGPKDLYSMIKGLTQREGPHGEAFGYKSVVSDVLAWAMKKATGKSLAQMVSERLWSRMGAEEDGFYLLDPIGTEVAMGGFNATLRDLGRLGQLMLNKGEVGGRQLIPREVVEEIMAGGDREAFARAGMTTRPGWSYKDQWWVTHNENGAFMAMGVYGQRLYVDPKARMVIAKLGSHPVASNAFTDLVHMKAFQALAKELSH